MSEPARPRRVGRYALYAQIATGGMASVHLGRLIGPVGFTRVVAIKQLHPHVSRDPAFVTMFLDEARVAARIRHPNVVQTLDVVAEDRDLFLVMEYIDGESLAKLLSMVSKRNEPLPARIAASILHGALAGLAAAHEARDEHGRLLDVVHRDISPHNILVGVDGVARVLDFGIAKALGRLSTTQTGQLKGKLPYMAPEQIRSQAVSPRTDIWGASVVLWEALTGSRLFTGGEREVISQVFEGNVPPPSSVEPALPTELDRVVAKGLALDPAARYASAREMAVAIENAISIAPASEISEWVTATAGETLAKRAALVREAESSAPRSLPDIEAAADSAPVSEPVSEPAVATGPAVAVTRVAPTVSTPPLHAPDDSATSVTHKPVTFLRALIPLLAGIVIGAVIVAAIVVSRSDRRSSALPTTSLVPAAPPVAESTAQPASEVESAPAPEPTVFELPPDWAPDAGPKPYRDKGPRAGTAPAPSADKIVSECEPPYYYEKGIKKFKPQCLRH